MYLQGEGTAKTCTHAFVYMACSSTRLMFCLFEMLKGQIVCLCCKKMDSIINCSVVESTSCLFMKSKLIEQSTLVEMMWKRWASVHISVSCQTLAAVTAPVNDFNLPLQLITHCIFTQPLCKPLPRNHVLEYQGVLFNPRIH